MQACAIKNRYRFRFSARAKVLAITKGAQWDSTFSSMLHPNWCTLTTPAPAVLGIARVGVRPWDSAFGTPLLGLGRASVPFRKHDGQPRNLRIILGRFGFGPGLQNVLSSEGVVLEARRVVCSRFPADCQCSARCASQRPGPWYRRLRWDRSFSVSVFSSISSLHLSIYLL